MTLTLSQLVKRHLAPEHAGALASALQQTPIPTGRITLHSMRTKEQVEIILGQNGNESASHPPVVHIGPDIPLDELVFVERDLEEADGLLPTSWKAAEQPRIASGKYTLFGVQDKKATTLFIIDREYGAKLAEIPTLHQLRTFETFRLFSDEREDTDIVTGLRSRPYVDRKVNNFYRLGAQTQYDLLAADLDHFKSLNDRFGNAAGDLGLKLMGQELIRALGKDGIGSRRHYGDETLLIALKDLLAKHPGGANNWANDINSRLRERSQEHFGDFAVQLTFGVYSLDEKTSYADAKKRADQALIYAKKHGIPIQFWNPTLPTHEEMQSGRYNRTDDPKLAAFRTAANRAFSSGIKPEQVEPARDILEDIIHKSQPVREAGNQEVLAELAHHLLIAQPSAMKTFSPERVFEAVYITRKNLGLLTTEEKTFEGNPSRIMAHFAERLNLKHLLEDDANKEEYNRTLDSYISCRYDDCIRTITASTDSQHQSRFIVSGRNTPTTGELGSFGEILNLLTTTYHFEDQCGLITLYRDDAPDQKTTIYFDNERFDISPISAQLADRNARIKNHLGLGDVAITADDSASSTPHYTFTAKTLEALQPLLWVAEDKEQPERLLTHIKLFKATEREYGANIPHAAQLLNERVLLDDEFAARLYKEPTPQKPWKDASTSTRITRRPITIENAPRLIREHYTQDKVTTRGDLPIFYAPEAGMVKLLSDLYIPRDIYLTSRNGEFTISNLRVQATEADAPGFDEIVTYLARTFNEHINGGGKLRYQIDRALPRLAHTPNFIGLRQLAIPISARYGELFCR